jgi:hypothetical protein
MADTSLNTEFTSNAPLRLGGWGRAWAAQNPLRVSFDVMLVLFRHDPGLSQWH